MRAGQKDFGHSVMVCLQLNSFAAEFLELLPLLIA
jgi:hypothetical protein